MSSGASIGGLVGGVIGATIGFFAGGNVALGWMIGSTLGGVAGGILDPTVVQQPGLNDKKLQTSQYGTMIGYLWGKFRTAGAVTWIGNNGELVEHEQSSGGKGGGPEVKSKSYTGSWQIVFNKSTRKGQDALKSILKWWSDGRVVVTADINPTVYTGWALQMPDSSMEADLGAGQVSAERYKGSAVFNEVQMDQFFNRLPNMEALVCTTSVAPGPITQVAYNEDTAWNVDVKIANWTTDWAASETMPNPTVTAGPEYVYIEVGPVAHRVTDVGTYVYANGDTVELWQDWTTFITPVGTATTVPGLGAGIEALGSADFLADAGVEDGRCCHGCALSADGTILIAITSTNTDYTQPCDMWHRIINGALDAEGTIDLLGGGELLSRGSFGVTNRIGTGVAGALQTASTVENDGIHIWQFGEAGWGVTAPNFPAPPNPLSLRLLRIVGGVLQTYLYKPVGDPDFWMNYGGPQPQSDAAALVSTEPGFCGVVTKQYDFVGNPPSTALYTRLGEGDGVTLATILADVFEFTPSSVGDIALTPDRYDVSAAEAVPVHGANFGAQMQKRNFIAMLEQAYNFDIVESDDGESAFLKVVFRGGDPVAEIPDEDLGVHEEGEGPKPLVELLARFQDFELPARVNVSHYDMEQQYQVGSQSAQRAWPYIDNVTKIDLPIVMTASQARNIAKRELYRAHLERDAYGITTSRKWAHLEPTDVIKVYGGEPVAKHLRIIKKTETPKGLIRFEGVLSAPYIAEHTDDAPPAEGTTPNPPSGPRTTTEMVLLDVPLVRDADAPYGVYAAVRGTLSTGAWTGASIQVSRDGGSTYVEVGTASSASTMGETTTALSDYAGPYALDWLSGVTVNVGAGTLESITEEALYNGGNLCLVGEELLQFMTAELVSAGVYTLSGLLRGRRGTEQVAVGHVIGERFVMMNTAVEVTLAAGDINQPRMFKAVTFGMTLTSATAVPFTNLGRRLRPYAPSLLLGGVNGSGDTVLQWTRRERTGGEWNDFADVALADPLTFVVEIWDATYTNCARVVSDIAAVTLTYTAAQQVADFGAAQETVYWRVARIGSLGPGLWARAASPGSGSGTDPVSTPIPPYVSGPSFPPPGVTPSVDATISSGNNNVVTTGFVIGNVWVAKFTTQASPAVTGAQISAAEWDAPPYFRRMKLCTDAAGASVVAEGAGVNPLISGVALANSTDYYIRLSTEFGEGSPSGPVGNTCQMRVLVQYAF